MSQVVQRISPSASPKLLIRTVKSWFMASSVEKRMRKFDHESWKKNTDDADDTDFSGGMGSGSDLRWSDPMQNPAFDLCPSVKSLWKIF